ncbi:DivIVA domain-containing protein [Echinicola sp. CAU 1574]|uniref:DivIVA domain-containing protein n=1 Tax=Echinicola arenosa TaxID=2774144 RepID=A0ABR9ANN0_9BACT|nr:DivIVA domain-containing protein [Echinicola arenosa]MBD8490391.1 DivIVA domain-containing protein [Echinicola arenosa]
MKITPLEIRQKTFEKNFRGFDKDEVSSFLVSLSQEWEREMDEKRELQIKLEQVEKESAKLREVEDSLFKTLKAAEDTGASMIEQANKTAELILKEAQMNSDAMISEAKNKSRSIIEEAESRAKRIIEDLKADVGTLVESYEDLLAQREIIIRNLKNLATDSLENIKQSQEDIKRLDMATHTKAVKDLSRQSPSFSHESAPNQLKEKSHTFVIEKKSEIPEEKPPISQQAELPLESKKEGEKPEKTEVPEIKVETPSKIEEPSENTSRKKESGSFFDQFD